MAISMRLGLVTSRSSPTTCARRSGTKTDNQFPLMLLWNALNVGCASLALHAQTGSNERRIRRPATTGRLAARASKLAEDGGAGGARCGAGTWVLAMAALNLV